MGHVWPAERKCKTVPRIVLPCDCVHPSPYVGSIQLPEALAPEGNTRKVNYKAVEVTNKRFECQWGKSRVQTITQDHYQL